jgi:phosphate/sulfate permease
MWHLWYLVGAGAGFCAAVCIICNAGQRMSRENTREARSNMVWSIVGSLLMMPMAGVLFAATIYLVMK